MTPASSTSATTTTSPSASADIPGRRRLQRHFFAWLDTLDPDMRAAMVAPATWLGVSASALLVISIAGYLPGARELFRLRAGTALLCFLPTIGLGLAIGVLEKWRRLSLLAFGFWSAVGSALFQFFMWSLVALSAMPGAVMMAAFPIFLAAYHGHMFRSSPKHPYIALGTMAAVAAAAMLENDPAHLGIYAVAGPVAVVMSVVLGHIAQSGHRARVNSIALREAVDAQLLHERAKHEELVSLAMLKLQGTHHDAGNALSGVLFSLAQLNAEARRRPLTEQRCENIASMAADVLGGFERLRALLDDARQMSRESAPAVEWVDVSRCAEAVAGELRGRFGAVEIAIECPDRLLHATVPVCGGAGALHRIVTNVAVNACEGNGALRAARVALRIADADAEGALVIEILDDGPGFSSELLASPLRAFHTTKAGGSGLGLYTADRLIRASRGRLRVRNLDPDRGASVQLVLPKEVHS